MKRFIGLLMLILFLCPSTWAGEVHSGSGRHGVELDVLFTYKPEEDNVERWKRVFNLANNKVFHATGGEVYLQKVNLIICPLEIEGGDSSATADVVIRRGDGRNASLGSLSGSSSGGVVLYDKGRTVEEDAESTAHELVHYFFGVLDEYKQTSEDKIDAHEWVYGAEDLFPILENLKKIRDAANEEGRIRIFDYILDEENRMSKYLDLTNFGTAFSNDLTSGTAITRRSFRQFCSDPLDVGPYQNRACIMDAGMSLRDGKIQPEYYGVLCNSANHTSGVATVVLDQGKLIWSQNAMALKMNVSCATHAKNVWSKYFGINLTLDGTIASGGAPVLEFEEKNNCRETVVLLLDKSGSMAGARMARLKSAAMGLIDTLDDRTKLGIVWFDSQPQAAVGIQELKDSRSLAKQAIAAIEASGGTQIGFGLGVAYQQLVLLRDPEKERGSEVIFLITDGESSDDPTSVMNVIRNDKVKVNAVSLGSDTDLSYLNEMATSTGGKFYYSADNEDIVRIVTQGATESLEGYTLVSEEKLSPSNEIKAELDDFVGSMLFQVEFSNVSAADLNEAAFVLLGPSGQPVPAVVRVANLNQNGALVTFALSDPPVGTYRVQYPSDALTESSSVRSMLLVRSAEVRMFAGVDTNAPEFPQPVVITAGVEGNKGTAHLMPVVAKVKRPDGSILEVPMYDDGSPSTGDQESGDGVYSARFARYSEAGPYSIEVVADNSSDIAMVGGGRHGDITDAKFGRFVRQKTLSFELKNYSALPNASLVLSAASKHPQQQLFSSQLSPRSGLVLANFRAQTGTGQSVVLDEFAVDLASNDVKLKNFDALSVYVDSNKDGLVDFEGPGSVAIGTTPVSIQDGKLKLQNGILLPAELDVELLVVGVYRADISVDESFSYTLKRALGAGVPLLVVPVFVMGMCLNRRRRFRKAKAAAVLLLLSLFTIGCTSSDEFVFTDNSESSPQTYKLQRGTVSSRLDLASVKASGEVDGLPATITVGTSEPIQGPEIVVETQVPE